MIELGATATPTFIIICVTLGPRGPTPGAGPCCTRRRHRTTDSPLPKELTLTVIHSFGRASRALFRLARHQQTRQLCSCWKILLTGDEVGRSENPRCHGELAENAHWICDLSRMGWQREWMWDTAILRSLSLSWFHCVLVPSQPSPNLYGKEN